MHWFRGSMAVLVLLVTSAHAEEAGKLAEQLEPLRPFLGKTWTGEFASSTPEKPLADVMRWERRDRRRRGLRRRDDLPLGRDAAEADLGREMTYHPAPEAKVVFR